MRLKVSLELNRAAMIPLNYQHLLTGAVYDFLRASDVDYARFLHEEGYASRPMQSADPAHQAGPERATTEVVDRRRFKLFTFSLLWAEHSRLDTRQRGAEKLHLQPGRVEWQISSPVEKFLQEFASGLLAASVLRVGRAELPIAQVETLPPPRFEAMMRFKCLSPVVAAVSEHSDGKRWTRYLRPKDPAWSERVRQNLLGKYAALHGSAPADDRLTLHFDAEYLKTHKGTKLMTYKDIQIVGAFCPLTLSGSTALIRIAYEAGLGEKNAAGCGMIEVVKTND